MTKREEKIVDGKVRAFLEDQGREKMMKWLTEQPQALGGRMAKYCLCVQTFRDGLPSRLQIAFPIMQAG